MWKNVVQPGRSQMSSIACWTSEASNTYSDYVTLIAFPLQ